MIEAIKGNLKGGAVRFSGFFPSMGTILGAGLTIKAIDTWFPKIRKRR